MLPSTFLSALSHLGHGKLFSTSMTKPRAPFADTQIGGKRGVGRDPRRSAAFRGRKLVMCGQAMVGGSVGQPSRRESVYTLPGRAILSCCAEGSFARFVP